MSAPQEAKPAKLVIGLFVNRKHLIEKLAGELSSLFGAIDIISAWMPFDYTSYYENEMGAPLFRRVFAFQKLIQQYDQCPDGELLMEHTDQDIGSGGRFTLLISAAWPLF